MSVYPIFGYHQKPRNTLVIWKTINKTILMGTIVIYDEMICLLFIPPSMGEYQILFYFIKLIATMTICYMSCSLLDLLNNG
jgi:hypothetical protein